MAKPVLCPLLLVAVFSTYAHGVMAQGRVTSVYTQLSDSLVHLPSGDSLEFQATGPAMVPSQAPGLMVTFYPFFPLADTARLRTVAIAFFRVLLPQLTSNPRFVVMRAVNVRARRRNQGGLYGMATFGVVLELHSDGRWYTMGRSAPAF